MLLIHAASLRYFRNQTQHNYGHYCKIGCPKKQRFNSLHVLMFNLHKVSIGLVIIIII